MTASKWVCTECWAVTTEPLTAPHGVNRCPTCRSLDIALMCDEPGCELTARITIQTQGARRSTCVRHCPWWQFTPGGPA